MAMEGVPINGMQPVSLHYELGIMFGFLASCILTVGVYYIFWQATQRRAEARDEARRKDLRERGFHHERGGYHDKALHRYASRDPIAQTQGQMLEFLTEPDQFKSSSSPHDSSPHEGEAQRFSHDEEDFNSVTTAAATAVTSEKHAESDETPDALSSPGLRINTHDDHHSGWREGGDSNLLHTGSAVSDRTPLSALHASIGQNTKDVI